MIFGDLTLRSFCCERLKMKPSASSRRRQRPNRCTLSSRSSRTNWDDSFGEFEMGSYSFPANEILFNVDNKAYMTEQQAFAEGEDGTDH